MWLASDLKLPLDHVRRDTFPLPKLGPVLRTLAWDLETGNGFFVLEGLQPKRYTPWENATLYVGISAYVSEERGRQDEEGNMLRALISKSLVICAELTMEQST